MSNKLQMRVFICTLLFFVVSMSAMLVYAQNKAVVIDEVEAQLGIEENNQTDEKVIVKNLNIQKDNDAGSFVIPLPQGITAEQVSIENKHILQELWVSVKDCEPTFFEEEWITGDTGSIISGTFEAREGRVVLRLLLTDIYECKYLMENGRLLVEPVNPHTVYDRIVVIDPLSKDQIWGDEENGISENSVALDIARKLQTRFAESNIKVYFTRLENGKRSMQLRQHFVDSLKPDFYVSIGTCAETEHSDSKYGVEAGYNTYFTPGFSSVMLADYLVREVATQTCGRGNGIWEGTAQGTEEDAAEAAGNLFYDVRVPAVQLRVGYLSNEEERELLAQDDYRDKIAEGIYRAILQMYKGEETDVQ